MGCFNIYIFNRQGTCIYYHEWFRPKSVKQGAGTLQDDQKQMFGLFWTLSNFCATMDPKDQDKPQLGTPRKIGQGCKFRSFTTNSYKCNFLEVPSGIKLVLNTHREAPDLTDVLQALYDDIFVEYVVKNPMYVPGQPFQSEQFVNALNAFLRQNGLLQQQQIMQAAV
ncbi:hypothetical protein Vretimale_15775 [Volvox reticuliferus]|uniref:Trafficking protein particle complex subunit n=1 Tax=Volvox reticuliferus TaxID=1737510 RepID=A0A8J4GR76_9CHLO|nr:hypothetical protein Vretifemale_18467 [Volvox reticuliferus]GIM12432.1 hypothetical protein Vretimale_15775 [Volvox reticuliferus]